MRRVGVLASGGGTNLQALLDAHPIAVVVSDKKDAFALERARKAGVPAVVVTKKKDETREAYDARLVQVLRDHAVDWVCLAGFMRLVTSTFLSAFPGRVLNIHPALLPAFPGLHAQEQAHAAGVRIAGATVHFVDTGTDTGPIIAQGAVPVLPGDTVDDLRARILTVEHRLYPMVLGWALEGRLHLSGRTVTIDGAAGEEVAILQPR